MTIYYSKGIINTWEAVWSKGINSNSPNHIKLTFRVCVGISVFNNSSSNNANLRNVFWVYLIYSNTNHWIKFTALFINFFVRLSVLQAFQSPPGTPTITGPHIIERNTQVTLQCTSFGGYPEPTVTWLRDDQVITTGVSITRMDSTVISSLTFTATFHEHLQVFECQADNGVLNNPLSTTVLVEVSCK